jgi:hypothetical protein
MIMIVGFNPRLVPMNRRHMVDQLHRAIETAREFSLNTLEFTCTEAMFALGLPTVFGGDFMETLISTKGLRFHLHMFYGHHSIDEVGICDTHAPARALFLRRMIQVIEYFEHNRPMDMYVIHSGARIVDVAQHMQALWKSLDVLRSLYPDIRLAIENGRPGTVLEFPDEVLYLLDGYGDVEFVFDTGLAYQAVGYNRELYAGFLRALDHFSDRLAEIHWNNTAPGAPPDRPLHVPLERGIDLQLVAHHLGRNPRAVHLIETICTQQPDALARDQRALWNALGAA